jgi:hypothetical protein
MEYDFESGRSKIRLDMGITPVILEDMKTAISIPDALFNATERLAKRLGISRSQLFQRAVKAFLRDHKDEGVTEALNNVYGSGPDSGKLDSVLDKLQAASWPREEW